jgi:hypothetical protein
MDENHREEITALYSFFDFQCYRNQIEQALMSDFKRNVMIDDCSKTIRKIEQENALMAREDYN